MLFGDVLLVSFVSIFLIFLCKKTQTTEGVATKKMCPLRKRFSRNFLRISQTMSQRIHKLLPLKELKIIYIKYPQQDQIPID